MSYFEEYCDIKSKCVSFLHTVNIN